MKYTPLIVCIGLLSSNNLPAMDKSQQQNLPITHPLAPEDEHKAFIWFSEHVKKLPSLFAHLTEQDKEIFNTRVSYKIDPKGVERSRYAYVDAFWIEAEKAGIELPYDKDTLKSIILKVAKNIHNKNVPEPTDELSARVYVYTSLLDEEKDLMMPGNFQKDQKNAMDVIKNWASKTAKKMAEIKLIPNTEEAIAQKAQEIFNEKVELLERYKCNQE